jgi:hypothetical protein
MDQDIEQLLRLSLEMKGLRFVPGGRLIIGHGFLLVKSKNSDCNSIWIFAHILYRSNQAETRDLLENY